MDIKEDKLQNELMRANISLVLDSYNDIFSSFDARGFSEKALSDDFLFECKRAAREKEDFGLELILSIPKTKRNASEEFKIKRRLKEHFKKHFLEKEKEMIKVKREGMSWVCLGALLVFSLVWGLVKFESIWVHSILTIFEVPGWFLIWEGMYKVFIDSRKLKPEYVFYKKMSNCFINFISY